jgi:competence ComEA-like helix-hairpin-helix protein
MTKKIILINFLFFIFIFFPMQDSFAFLPSKNENSIFLKIRKEIINIHSDAMEDSNLFDPKEEAIIVIIKGIINKDLGKIGLINLPKEFLIKTLTEGGKRAFSMATSDPFELITSEIVNKSVDEVIDVLKQEGVYITSGKVELNYTDINQKKRKEVFYHSIVMNEKTGETSVSFYSNKEIFAPRSNPGSEPANYEWRSDDFKREKLRPFIVTFSGTIVEGSTGALKFSGDVGFNIDFMSQEEIEELRNVVMIQAPSVWEQTMETAINVGGFFVEKTGEAGDLFSDGWGKTKETATDIGGFLVEKTGETADFVGDKWDRTKFFAGGAFGGLSGATSYGEGSGVVIDLNDINRNQSLAFNQEKNDEQEVFGADDIEEKVDDEVDDKREEEEKEQDQKEIVVSVELNSALGEDLELLSGIGPVYAERIIGNRPFCSLDDLTKVPGIGEATLRNIREQGLAYVSPAEICFQEEEEEVDEATLEKFEEIKRRIERLREKVDETAGSEEEQEEEIEEEQEQEEVTSVEINSASKEELELLIGVGPAYAERIIENRPFCLLDDLERVSGIGEKTIENIKDQDLAYVDAPDSCFEEEDDDDRSRSGSGGGSTSPPDDEEEDEGGEADDGDENEDEDDEDEEEVTSVEINSASKEHLELLDGVGEVIAQSIIDYRQENVFCSLDDLENVNGIGPATLENIKTQGLAYVNAPDSCFEDDEEEEESGDENDEEENDDEDGSDDDSSGDENDDEEENSGEDENGDEEDNDDEDGGGEEEDEEGDEEDNDEEEEEGGDDDESDEGEEDEGEEEKETDIGEDFRIVYSGGENLYRVDIEKEESLETDGVVLEGSSNLIFDEIDNGSRYITDDGEYFYLGDDYGALYKVRMATGKRMWDYEVDSGSVSKIETWEDYVIFSSTKGKVYKINKETGESEVLWNGGSRIYDMEIYDNKLYLGLSSDYDNNFKEINLDSGNVLREVNCGGAGSSVVTVTNNDSDFYMGSNSSGSSIIYDLDFDDFSCEAIYYVNIVTRSGGEYVNQLGVEEDYLYIAKRGASGYSGSVSRVFLETNESDWSYNPEEEIDFENLVILGDYIHALDSEHDKVHWINKKTGEGGVLTEDSAINNLHLTEEDLIQQKTVPTINLAVDEYDLYDPSDVVIDIIWNDAEQEAEVIYSNEVVLEEDNDYLVEADQLTIYQSFFDNKEPEEGDVFNFEIFFDIEETSFQVETIDTTPEEEESGDDSDEDDEEEVTRVEINSASKEHLELLDGVGEVIAQSIIDYRTDTPFCSLDDLINVSGIGDLKLNDIKTQGLASVDAPDSCFEEDDEEGDEEESKEGGDDDGSDEDDSEPSNDDPLGLFSVHYENPEKWLEVSMLYGLFDSTGNSVGEWTTVEMTSSEQENWQTYDFPALDSSGSHIRMGFCETGEDPCTTDSEYKIYKYEDNYFLTKPVFTESN